MIINSNDSASFIENSIEQFSVFDLCRGFSGGRAQSMIFITYGNVD